MRVAILQPDSELYGAAKAMLQAVGAMTGGDERIEFEAWFPYDGPAIEAYRRAGIKPVIVPELAILRRGGGAGGTWRLARQALRSRRVVRRLARERGVDVLHSNSMVMLSGAAARLWTRRGPAHVWQIREAPQAGGGIRAGYRLLTRMAADRVIAVSAASQAFGPADTELIADGTGPVSSSRRARFGPHNASGEAAELRVNLASMVVLMVARLLPTKGQEQLLEAFAPVARRFPNTELWFAGTTYAGRPEHARRLLAASERLDLTHRVHWLGYVDDVDALYSHARTVVVATAAGEGFGLAALEAMAHGVPPIVAGAGGTAELVTHDRSALIATPGDTAALRAALELMLGDDALHARLSVGALADSRRFDIGKTAAALRTVFEQAARERRRRG